MPYEDSPYFKTPCHTKTLWRYMHIDKFLAMLNGKTLYFPNIYSFDDKSVRAISESRHTVGNRHSLQPYVN